jgi:glycerate kinase
LRSLAKIIAPPDLPQVRIIVATDVDNPLYGKRGAAWQFAAQKGADVTAIIELDRGLRQLAAVARRSRNGDFTRTPGAGAAGGCGFGLLTFFNATQRAGFDVLCDYVDLDNLVGNSDLLITGEGTFDRTSLAGKAPCRLAALAQQLGVPVWGIFGRIELAARNLPFDRSCAVLDKNDAFDPDADHATALAEAAFRLARNIHP